jgi:uncharacterized membrane protein YgaE (UPF0421/DUF939 family)
MKNKKILFLALLAVLVSPGLATAVSPQKMVSTFAGQILVALDAIVFAGWVITGILYLTANGSPEKLSTAKKAVFACVIGTILAVVSASACSVVSTIFGLSGVCGG